MTKYFLVIVTNLYGLIELANLASGWMEIAFLFVTFNLYSRYDVLHKNTLGAVKMVNK